MAKKITDILKVLNTKLSSNEFSAAIGASNINEVEISDEEFEKLNTQIGGMLTIDSALNSKEIIDGLKPKLEKKIGQELYDKHKVEILHGVETELGILGKKMGVELDGKAHEMISQLKKHASGFSGVPDERIQKVTSENDKLHEQIRLLSEEKDKIKVTFEKEKENFQIANQLERKMSKFPLQKAYKDELVQAGLYSAIAQKVQSIATLKLDPVVGIKPFSKENPDLEFYKNNKPQGVDDILGEFMQPYVEVAPSPSKPNTPNGVIKTGESQVLDPVAAARLGRKEVGGLSVQNN